MHFANNRKCILYRMKFASEKLKVFNLRFLSFWLISHAMLTRSFLCPFFINSLAYLKSNYSLLSLQSANVEYSADKTQNIYKYIIITLFLH